MKEPMMDDPKLPPLDSDDNDASLGWHALNYRTAHTLDAQGAYEELERFVQAYARRAVLADRAAAHEAVSALIRSGHLRGNGCDDTAQNNGVIIAANLLSARMTEGE